MRYLEWNRDSTDIETMVDLIELCGKFALYVRAIRMTQTKAERPIP
jgi:hypothetical protein